MQELERRAEATKKTLARFEGKPFDWKTSGTCIHLFRYHAQQMGHDIQTVPRFRSIMTAKRALKELGHDDLPALLNGLFPSVPPAMLRVGDVMAVPGDAGFHALMIRASVRKWIGWHEDAEGCTIIDADMTQAAGAWRL